MNKVEVIAWSLDDAIEIYKAGAHRIELVADLERGGLTPDINLVKQVSKLVEIPVRVMLRHTDESFVYDDELMNEHLEYIEKLKETDAEGIVFGSLTKEGKINFDQLEQVIKAKGDMKLAFHRAFDELSQEDIESEFEKLSKYDVDTLLTSGTCSSAWEGKDNIKKLIEKGTINILPGKSISIDNAKDIIDYTGADYVHVGYAIRDVANESGKIDKTKIEELINSVNK